MAALPTTLPIGTPLVDLHTTWGAVYIGCLFSIGLLGMTMIQAWFYYSHFPNDSVWIKSIVTVICIVEFLRSTFTAHAAHFYLVQNWGNPAALDIPVWSIKTIILTTTIGKWIGHLFFIWRIYVVFPGGKLRYILPVMILSLSFWDTGMAINSSIALFQATSITAYGDGSQKVLSPFAFAVAVATDIAITTCLIFALTRNRTGFSKTNTLINTLVFYAMNVGVITVLSGSACLALTLLSHNRNFQFDYIGLYAIVGNLYANSLLATLNARDALRNDTDLSTMSSIRVASRPPRHYNGFFTRDAPTSSAPTYGTDSERAVHLQTFDTTQADVMDKKCANGRVIAISPGGLSPSEGS